MKPTALAQIPDPSDTERELARRKLSWFVRHLHPELQTGTPLSWGWYLDAIADHLDAVARGEIKRICINVLNRSLKSMVSSVCFPAFCWLERPWLRILSSSHASDLAVEHSWASRQLMMTDAYQALALREDGQPSFRFVGDQNTKEFYANDKGGRRIATQVGSGTGKGGHIVMVDDPLSIDQAFSETATATANRWLFNTLWTRQDDPSASSFVIVMHRLRRDDPTAEAVKKELGFEVLSLPLEYEPAKRRPPTSIGWEDPRMVEGESLHPSRWTPAVIAHRKVTDGDLYHAICQQDPVASGAKPLKAEWFARRWTSMPAKFDQVIMSWDTSFKGMDPTKAKTKRSRTAGFVLGVNGAEVYVLDHRCEQMDFNQQQDAITEMVAAWPEASTKLIEDEANGAALITSLGKTIPGIVGCIPKGSKYMRLVAVTPFFRAGNVLFPPDDSAPWVSGCIQRFLDYPSVDYDDEIDAMSQGLKEILLPPTPEDDEEAAAAILAMV